ncbi:MAG: SGNH/GDSL hydrolase family protein [Clostridiales bacterium]|nr:SGNH/GDSL hydrolase family protein [Clostridiales bacterium]
MLGIDELRAVTHGGLVELAEDGSFCFYRMTDKQYRYFVREEDVRFKHRYVCAAGICLDFYTTARSVRFDYELFEMSDRDIAQIDVCLDGLLIGGINQKPELYLSGTIQIEIPENKDGFRRVTIWLPYMSRVRIKNLSLSQNAVFIPVHEKRERASLPRRRKLLCYGDSITQGYDALHPSQTYAVRLARYFDWELWNAGLSGYQFDHLLLDEELPFEPDIVTIAFGTNDWNKRASVQEAVEQAELYFHKIKRMYKNARVLYISPLWRADIHTSQGAGGFHAFCDALLDAAKRCDIPALDGRGIVPHVPEAFDDRNLYPNDWGMSCYSEALIRYFTNNPM